MNLVVPREILRDMEAQGCTNEVVVQSDTGYMWGTEHVESSHLSPEDLALMSSCAKEYRKKYEGCDDTAGLIKRLKTLNGIAGKRGKPVCKPEVMAELLIEHFKKTEHHWLFVFGNDSDVMLPYVVTKIRYVPAETRGEHYTPAYVKFQVEAHERGDNEVISHSWEGSDFGKGGCTVEQLLDAHGLITETPDLVATWLQDIERYQQIRGKLGHQFLASGQGVDMGEDEDKEGSRSHYRRSTGIRFDGNARVVMNDTFEEGKNLTTRSDLWGSTSQEREAPIKLPVHPMVVCFDLTRHSFAKLHVRQLRDYKYNKTAEGKLVLREDNKELIETLVRASEERSQDIIKGKSGGVIMLLSGAPGTGKTLTAEVYSEFVRRPLYVVQCSQLGVSAEQLEKRLQVVLDRANRWKAVLLIDEADVYIHERGVSIEQNAIVGVFLRILEHYNGVLFMTTNRATVVDDAVMSRMIAHVKYSEPDADEAVQLWRILSTQYDVGLSDDEIHRAVKAFPGVSGRSVKNMLRLAKVMAQQRKTSVDVKLLKHVSKFQEAL